MEKKVIRNKISKAEIAELPKESFEGKIIVVQSEAEAAEAVRYLNEQTLVGIDSETRPSFTKGNTHKVALLQISTAEYCFLFRLNLIGITPDLAAFLENPKIVKVGLSLKDDFLALHKRAGFKQQSCIELQEYVKAFKIEDKSLQKIYAILFGKKISKSQRLSNWEADILSDSQKLYAATDAWACYHIYEYLDHLKKTRNYVLEKTVEEVIAQENKTNL